MLTFLSVGATKAAGGNHKKRSKRKNILSLHNRRSMLIDLIAGISLFLIAKYGNLSPNVTRTIIDLAKIELFGSLCAIGIVAIYSCIFFAET